MSWKNIGKRITPGETLNGQSGGLGYDDEREERDSDAGLSKSSGNNQFPKIFRNQTAKELLKAMKDSETESGIPVNIPERSNRR